MKPFLYRCNIFHTRNYPVRHTFRHAAHLIGVSLENLQALNAHWPLSGWNRVALFSLLDRDLLREYHGSLAQRLAQFLKSSPVPAPQRVVVVFFPRVFYYAFQPVSFFLCFNDREQLTHVVAEVHNTFGQTYRYVIPRDNSAEEIKFRSSFEKQFFVSPFLDVSGTYELVAAFNQQSFSISISLTQSNQLVFESTVEGHGHELSGRRLLGALLLFPLAGILTMLRIEWQALVLWFIRRVPVASAKQEQRSTAHTTTPGFFDHLRRACLKGMRFFDQRKSTNARSPL